MQCERELHKKIGGKRRNPLAATGITFNRICSLPVKPLLLNLCCKFRARHARFYQSRVWQAHNYWMAPAPAGG
jgi:hypothetical protein